MENATDITTAVSNAELTVFNKLHQRMDKDYERWKLEHPSKQGSFEYMTHVQARDTDIDVVSNAPRTFSDSVQAILSSADRQIICRMAESGADVREEIGKLERLLEYAFEKADERLVNMLMPPLKDALVWYSIVRGWLAARFLVYKVDGEVVFDFLPYDPRWLTYRRGANGLLWTACTDNYTAEELEDEYGKEVGKRPWYKPWQKEKSEYPVIDYWRREGPNKISNAIICENDFLKEPETYNMKSFPVLIAPVATRPPVKGKTQSEMEGYGESIFAPNREIDSLLNRLGSMWASHANLLYKQPTINYYGDEGIKDLKSTPYLAEAVINLPANQNRLEPSPMKEISPTLVNLVNWLDSMRIKGSLPDINVSTPPPSGTLYNLVQETSNRVFNPQIRNLQTFYSNACRLIEEQLLAGGVGGGKIGKFTIRGEQKKQYFENEIKPVDLKRPHIIKVEFTARTPWSQLDTYQVADMAKRQGLPQEFINEYILKLPDPKGLGDLSAIEMAEHSPKLAMLRAIKALIKAERFEEANQLMEDMYNMYLSEQGAINGQNEMVEPGAVERQSIGEPTSPIVGGA